MDTNELIAIVGIGAPVTVGIVQGAKASGLASGRWAMPFAIMIGVVIDLLIAATDIIDHFDIRDDFALAILAGIVTGLTASGLFSGFRAVAGSA